MIDFQMLWDRIRYITIHPPRAWETIRMEKRSVRTVHLSFLIPILIIISFSAFAGSMIYNPAGFSILFPVVKALKQFICIYLTILLSSWVINELSVAFIRDTGYSFNFKLVTYSLTPLYITVIITRFIPDLALLNILSVYGGYILFTGLKTIESITQRSLIRYFIVVLLTVIVLYLAINWISRSLLEGMYFAFARSV